MQKIILTFFTILSFHSTFAQQKYWVFFKDKPLVSFNPYEYFDREAIERRQLSGLALFDSTDLPVNEKYITEIQKLSDSIGNVSRWLNGMGAWISSGKLEAIKQLPFVKNIEVMTMDIDVTSTKTSDFNSSDSVILFQQVNRLQGEKFISKNLDGKGIRIAVFDVGYSGADKHPAFEYLRSGHQILKTWDFIEKSENVYAHGSHGTMVLSCIAGRNGDKKLGLAQGAEFLLARTERLHSEYKDEEDNWVAAAEWADKNGARIISSSLGYTNKRYFTTDMNGHVSKVAQGAVMASKKGMLVVNAAGNEGISSWKYICTPADAESILTVGGIDPVKGYHINFSSYGPSADGRIKPDVCAPGQVYVADPKDFKVSFGTSFATPLVAGFAACAWQSHKTWTNIQLLNELHKSGLLYPYYDYAHGYGTPQAGYFTEKNIISEPTFTIDTSATLIKIRLNNDPDSIPGAKISSNNDPHLLYYHISDAQGHLKTYFVVSAHVKEILTLNRNIYNPGEILRVHYMGYTGELKL